MKYFRDVKILFNFAQNLLDKGYKPNEVFDEVCCFKDGLAKVKLKDKYNFINCEGKIISDRGFDEVEEFVNGFAPVKLNDKWNFISIEGDYLSEQWFDMAWEFTDKGYAFVMIDGEGLFVDRSGKTHKVIN